MASIVLVKLEGKEPGTYTDREYSYFTEEPLEVGDTIIAPVKAGSRMAIVTKIDVEEKVIEAYRDSVKTILAGSKVDIADTPPPEPDVTMPPDLVAEPTTLKQEPTPARPVVIFTRRPENDLSIDRLARQVERACTIAEHRTIVDKDSLISADQDLHAIVGIRKALEIHRKDFTGPLNAEIKGINDYFKTMLEPIDRAETSTRQLIIKYNQDLERRRLEIDRIEAEKLRLARAEEEATGEHTVDLTPIPKPVEPVRRIVSELGSTTTREIRKWEVEDKTKVPPEYLIVDEKAIGKLVRAGIPSIPGIKIWTEPNLRVTNK